MAQQFDQAWWGTWWPWAEANQGFLSVAALAAAFGFAYFEFRRANQAEHFREQAFINAAIAVIIDFVHTTRELRDELASEDSIKKWRRKRDALQGILTAMLPVSPGGRHAVIVANMLGLLHESEIRGLSIHEAGEALQDICDVASQHANELGALRPEPNTPRRRRKT